MRAEVSKIRNIKTEGEIDKTTGCYLRRSVNTYTSAKTDQEKREDVNNQYQK